MVGKSSCPAWIQTDWILEQFGKQRKLNIAKYMDFVLAGMRLPSIWDNLGGQIYLGKEAFIKKMQKHSKTDKNISEFLAHRGERRPDHFHIIRHAVTEMKVLQQPIKRVAIQ